MSKIRKLLLWLPILLPSPLKCAAYRLLGWKIGSRVRIGLSYLDALDVTLGDGVRIGHFNVFRNLKRLSVGPNTVIINFNEFFGTTYGPEFPGRVDIGAGVSWMSHHFVDAAGDVQVGDQAIIAGRDTHFWTHEARLAGSGLRLAATRVEIGSGAYVGARATLLGCSVPPGAVVGAGSVVTKDFAPELARLLIAGNPASVRKRYLTADNSAESGTEDADETLPAPSVPEAVYCTTCRERQAAEQCTESREASLLHLREAKPF